MTPLLLPLYHLLPSAVPPAAALSQARGTVTLLLRGDLPTSPRTPPAVSVGNRSETVLMEMSLELS